jgi:hypothetical protein
VLRQRRDPRAPATGGERNLCSRLHARHLRARRQRGDLAERPQPQRLPGPARLRQRQVPCGVSAREPSAALVDVDVDVDVAAAKRERAVLWSACAARAPAPQPLVQKPSISCHTDYHLTCIPIKGDGSGAGAANDLDRSDIGKKVQLRQVGVDPYRLDSDDGFGCDSY